MLHVLGLGVAEQVQLNAPAEQALRQCSTVIGSPRQLETVRHYLHAEQHLLHLPSLTQLADLLSDYRECEVCILASGDPLYYGIGRWLLQRYARHELRFYPAVSSIQAACHAVGLALQDVQVVSLHGRALLSLRRYLARQRYLVILTDQYSHPAALAAECQRAGFAESRLWVCEKLGYQDQQVREFSVTQLLETPTPLSFDALHVTVIEVQGQGGLLPVAMGIPDQDFNTGDLAGHGLLTKREVRMAILGLLQPRVHSVGWDIGAGCGGVAVEWALANASSQVHAVEHHSERLHYLQQNREHFGVVDNLHIMAGRAPQCLADLPDPQQIFIGGSGGELADLLQICWQRLAMGGVLVASVVTEQNRQVYLQFADTLPETAVETLQVAINKGSQLAGQWVYRPKLPVTLFKFSKES